MKKVFKKVMVTLMAAALLMGVLAAQTDTVQAGNKAFANSSCSPNNRKIAETDWDYEHGGYYEIYAGAFYGQEDGGTYRMEKEKGVNRIAQGKVIYAGLSLSPKASVKSTSVKSSNKKVIKADKKKGTFKAVKPGTATISFKVVWSTSDTVEVKNALYSGGSSSKYSKTKKSGNTYTTSASLKVKVICKSHKGKWIVKKAASCKNEGTKQRVCSVCGEKETDTIEETDHKYDDATHKCTVCGNTDPNYEG